jgi:hypothetical protein
MSDTQEEIPLILGRPFVRDVNARIDVETGKIQFCIGRRNMTFQFQAKEEQCYLVQDEEARGGGSHGPNTRKKVAPTKPKKSKETNKAKGEKKTEIKNTVGVLDRQPTKGSTRSR